MHLEPAGPAFGTQSLDINDIDRYNMASSVRRLPVGAGSCDLPAFGTLKRR